VLDGGPGASSCAFARSLIPHFGDWTITWDHIAPGTYRLTAVATDNDGLTTTSAAANVAVVAPVTIDTMVLPQAQIATPYSVTLAATGGTGASSWSVAAGALPLGLSLSASGLIAGTPLQSGSFSFTVSARDIPSNAHRDACVHARRESAAPRSTRRPLMELAPSRVFQATSTSSSSRAS
jgi:hypothetical protein